MIKKFLLVNITINYTNAKKPLIIRLYIFVEFLFIEPFKKRKKKEEEAVLGERLLVSHHL